MALYGTQSLPECRVSFMPQSRAEPLIVRSSADRIAGASDPAHDSLIAVSTQKDIGQPCGQFSVVLVDAGLTQERWADLLRVGDMVLIELGPDSRQPDLAFTPPHGWPHGLEPVMVGTIDEVRQSFVMGQNGKPQRSVTVTGRDLAKYLVDDQIWWDAWSDVERATAGFSPEVDQWLKSGQDGAKAAGLIQFLLTWLSSRYEVSFNLSPGIVKDVSGEFPLYGLLLRAVLFNDTPALGGAWSWESYQGAPWSMMQRAAALPFTVLVYDLRREWDIQWITGITGGFLANAQPGPIHVPRWNTDAGQFNSISTLMLYRNPWSNRDYEDWTIWPTRVVKESDLISADLSRSGAEITNTWRLRADVQGPIRPQESGKLQDAVDTRDFVSIRRYGERPLLITAPFINGNPDEELLKTLQKYTFRLKDWNRWNEHFLSGRLTFKGMASIRVGDRLWYWDHDYGTAFVGGFEGGIDFYVESVTQDFQAFSHWTTTVSVTRGQKHRDAGQPLQFTDVPTGQPRGVGPALGFNATTDRSRLLQLEELARQVRVGS